MDKKVLSEYIDACKLVEETEQEIKNIRKKKIPSMLGNVKGSNPEFPYQPQNFHISGAEFDYGDDRNLRRLEKALTERKEKAEEIKAQTEEWMNTIPMRMQRIIKYKIFQGLTWEETAARIGRKATGEGIRKELDRFFEEK